jgi:crotonobetainyl-CoA:carnitine CoA-transferase CaiB-like acyl-CoA transferase
MVEGILGGVRVVELAGGQALAVAGLLLAEAGAEVIKVEADRGERGQARFAAWNRSKQSLLLDVASPSGRIALDELLDSSDVFLTDWTPERLRQAGLDDQSLARAHPHVIAAVIGGWPAGHPLAERPVDDTIVLAESGLMDEQRGVRDGPIYLRFALGSWGAAYFAAIGVVARLIQAGRGGGIGGVATSLLQGAMLPAAMLWRRAEFASPALVDSMNKAMMSPQFECADGVWLHLKAPPDDAPLMRAALDALGPDRIAQLNKGWPSNHTCINRGANAHIFKTRSSAEWLADLWAVDIPVQADVPMGAIYQDEQARINGYVVDVLDAELGKTRQPGVPCTIDPPMRVKSAAPVLGSATLPKRGVPRFFGQARAPQDTLPLGGVKVADFGSFVAGPLATMIMGDLGADVIKIEGTGGDVMRRVEGAFLGAQRGKRSLALDLKSPASGDDRQHVGG